MSKARRDTKCVRCSIFWNGQANSPVQRARAPSSPLAVVLAHHVGVQRTRAFLREMIGLRALRPLVDARTSTTCGMTSPARWIDHGVADADVAALAQRLALAPMPLISSSLCSVAFCTTTPPTATGSSLRDRRQRAGAADLDVDVAQRPSSRARPGTCARSPSAACARRSRAAPASRGGRPCRRRRRCRSRAAARCVSISRWKASSSSTERHELASADWS